MKNRILRAIEKLLTSLLVTLLLAIASFSYMTGHFPPRATDVSRTYHLAKGMLFSTQEHSEKTKSIQSQGQAPSLEQVLELQKLGVKRLELTVEFLRVFKTISAGAPSPEMAQKINTIQEALITAETTMNEVNASIEKMMEGK